MHLPRDRTSWPEASLARLEPSFAMMGAMGFGATALRKCTTVEQITHLHHAGNSSGIVDGAALMLIGSAEAGRRAGLVPRARIRSMAVIGSEPTTMLTGSASACGRAISGCGRSTRPLPAR